MDFIKPQLLPFIVFNIPPVPFLHTIKNYQCRGSFRVTVFRLSEKHKHCFMFSAHAKIPEMA